MKKVIIAVCSFVAVVALVFILFTVQGRDIRQTEIENALSSSMEKAMNMVVAEEGWRPETDEELSAMFIEALATQIDSSSSLTVNILESDAQKGILSAEAILTYYHPIGTTGTVSCTKTMILEEYELWVDTTQDYTITFNIDDSTLFKSYTLSEGETYIDPGTPTMDGKTFVGWKNNNTGAVETITGKTVTIDASYTAVFEESGVMNQYGFYFGKAYSFGANMSSAYNMTSANGVSCNRHDVTFYSDGSALYAYYTTDGTLVDKVNYPAGSFSYSENLITKVSGGSTYPVSSNGTIITLFFQYTLIE